MCKSASKGSLFREAGGNERHENWIEAIHFIAIIIAMDTTLSSAERVYFDGVVN